MSLKIDMATQVLFLNYENKMKNDFFCKTCGVLASHSNKKISFLFALFIFGFISLFFVYSHGIIAPAYYSKGLKEGIINMQEQAVKDGFAEYKFDENGKPVWSWRK